MRELGCFQDLAPLVLLPLRTKLLIALDDEHPVAVAGARHRGQVPFIPSLGVVMIDTSAHFFCTRHCAWSDPFLVNKYGQLVEGVSDLLHPRHRLLGEIVRGQQRRGVHDLFAVERRSDHRANGTGREIVDPRQIIAGII